jgi:hypothetical protein
MGTPRGITNKNPGNIRPGSEPWKGQIAIDDHNFCVFDTEVDGLRALAKQLLAYHDHHGLTTIRQYIDRWAPPVENDTGHYVSDVCARCMSGPDDAYDLHHAPDLDLIMKAIVHHEQGQQPYTDAQFDEAIADAYA